ncbi:MAG: hypothetical protein JW818_21775 [Pirellulales bacterium]|nr:hypothetical protein [Pirellulales bacterium]
MTASGEAKGDESMTQLRNKPHVNIGIIGNTGRGRTRLATAIAGICTPVGTVPSLEELQNQVERQFVFLEYESRANHYAHIVFPEKARLSDIYQQLASLDGCVLYLDTQGITSTARAQLLMATAAGVSKVIVFVDADSGLSDAAKDGLMSLFRKAGLTRSDIPFVQGSTRQGREGLSSDAGDIAELVSQMDSHFKPRSCNADDAFLMPIDDVFLIAGRGIVVTGRVERGVVHEKAQLDIVGPAGIKSSRCLAIETFRQQLDAAGPGDHIGVLLDGVRRSDCARGMVLAQSGSLRLSNRFMAHIFLEKPHTIPSQADFLFHTSVVRGRLSATVNNSPPGSSGISSADVELSSPYGLEDGLSFVMSVDGEFVGIGAVARIQNEE